MVQPNFGAITNSLQAIQNEAAFVGNMPAAVGVSALQQQMNANHMQVVAALGNKQAQVGQMQNEDGPGTRFGWFTILLGNSCQ